MEQKIDITKTKEYNEFEKKWVKICGVVVFVVVIIFFLVMEKI